MNKTIKKIVALSMGATMLAGTAAMALATDLSNYPAPFVKDGAFVGKIVIGEKAGTVDVVGALDISASLQRAASRTVAGSGTSASVEGGVRLDNSGDRIYYGSGFQIDSVSSDNLALLADGTFEDDEGDSYDFTQSILLSSTKTLDFSNTLQASDSEADSYLGFDLGTTASSYAYKTKVDFTQTVNATHDDVIGNKVVLFGNEYTFSSESTATKLVFYGSSEQVSMSKGEEVTKTINGKEYTVKIIGLASSGSSVSVQVNGETKSISEGSSSTFSGLKIYAKSVDSWDGGTTGTEGYATLQLGAEKVVLEDGEKVAVGSSEDDIDGTLVDLGGTPSALTYIYISVAGDDSDTDALKQGGEFKDPVYKTFKLSYPSNNFNLMDDSRDVIEVTESGADKVLAKLPTINGEKTIYFNYQGNMKWDSNAASVIHLVEGAYALEDSYIYLAPADPKYTHFVKVTNIKTDDENGYVEFQDVLTGADYKTTEGNFNDTTETVTLTADGKDYVVTLVVSGATPKIAATYTDSQTVVYPEIELKSGETFFLTNNVSLADEGLTVGELATLLLPGYESGVTTVVNASATTVSRTPTNSELAYRLTFGPAGLGSITPTGNLTPAINFKAERNDLSAYEVISVPTTYSTTTTVGTPTFTGVNSGSEEMENDDLNAYVDLFGTYVTTYDGDGDNDGAVKLYYPNEQMYANVFLSPIAAAVTTTSSTGAVALTPISVGMAILDSDATVGGSTPYIVVGGPCANTAAAELMGNGADCAAGFTAGKAIIKLYADKNALLVAGYSGQDTQGACRVLAEYKSYGFSGTELEVVTANLQSLSVKKVSN